MRNDSVSISVDMSAVNEVVAACTSFGRVLSTDAQYAAIEAAEEVLAASNALIPVDTGTAAQSAGYEVTNDQDTVRVVAGYGVKSDPINPRTGQPASSYLLQLHEDLSVAHANGQAKFLEMAVLQNPLVFYNKLYERVSRRCPGEGVDTAPSSGIKHTDYMSPATSRIPAGWSATHNNGQLTPYRGGAE